MGQLDDLSFPHDSGIPRVLLFYPIKLYPHYISTSPMDIP